MQTQVIRGIKLTSRLVKIGTSYAVNPCYEFVTVEKGWKYVEMFAVVNMPRLKWTKG